MGEVMLWAIIGEGDHVDSVFDSKDIAIYVNGGVMAQSRHGRTFEVVRVKVSW